MSAWTAEEMGSQAGTTVVVTGANRGIGAAVTRAFATRGATVIMACRDVERGQDAAASIEGEGTLDVRRCDLADLASVASFADEVRQGYEAVDVLCNNAGIMGVPAGETADGFERQIGVNHLGHFALTGHLLDHLSETVGRVVTQSSGMHTAADGGIDDVRLGEDYDRWGAYARSKLANVLFAYELQRRIERSERAGPRSLACHPGYADTELQTRMASTMRFPFLSTLTAVANRLFAQSPERGALPMLYAATADVPGGHYVGPDGFMNMRGAPARQTSSDTSHDPTLARDLWEKSVAATGVSYPLPGAGA